jgi:hypothetical protein
MASQGTTPQANLRQPTDALDDPRPKSEDRRPRHPATPPRPTRPRAASFAPQRLCPPTIARPQPAIQLPQCTERHARASTSAMHSNRSLKWHPTPPHGATRKPHEPRPSMYSAPHGPARVLTALPRLHLGPVSRRAHRAGCTPASLPPCLNPGSTVENSPAARTDGPLGIGLRAEERAASLQSVSSTLPRESGLRSGRRKRLPQQFGSGLANSWL